MGSCNSTSSPVEKETAQRSQGIDKDLSKERKAFVNEIRLLLLGAGDSGKSTIAKQMKIIHLKGFTKEERIPYRAIVHSNCYVAMRSVVLALCKIQAMDKLSDQNKQYAELFINDAILSEQTITKQLGDAIASLWQDPTVQGIVQQSATYQILDSAPYFFDNIVRIADPNFLPDDQDILRSRTRTTGIVEITFTDEINHYRLVDVGGQRTERRKWIHCFQDVSALLFCVAMSEFNQTLYEDGTVNRMRESLLLFEEICNCRWFSRSAIVLFLNKSDIFKDKIQRISLKDYFPEYKGANTFEDGSTFIKEKFLELNKNKQKWIYTHITCATDTENVKFVFAAVRDNIITLALAKTGF